MKFAFSTIACPAWDAPTVAARAKEWGYAGVECGAGTVASLLQGSTPGVRKAFADAGVEIACLASGIALPADAKNHATAAGELRRCIELAAELGCARIKVFAPQVRPGQMPAPVADTIAQWILPLADLAADRQVAILVENAASFRRSHDMWLLLEQLAHPAIGTAWDLLGAARMGEGPAVSIPTLNARMQFVQCQDAKIAPQGATLCKFGEGDVQMKKAAIRLLGIGYKGFVSVHWDEAMVGSLATAEQALPDALVKFKEWIKPLVEAKPAKKEPPKKDAAAPAATPAAPAAK